MKILFVNPPTTFEQIYGEWDLSALDTYTPPLGVMHLASHIRTHGYQPAILDLQVGTWHVGSAADHVLASTPDVIGISAMTINILNAGGLAEELRRRGFGGPIILGGAHVTAVPVDTLDAFPSIDFGVLGEGELTLLELLDTIHDGRSPEGVRGIVQRDANRQIVLNDSRPFIADLDSLPMPAWDLLDGFPAKYPSSLLESKRVPAAGIMTSRGCPFQCTFCDNRVFGRKVRHFSAEYSLNMIRHLIATYGIKDLMFFDDNLMLNEKKLAQICNCIIEEKMDITWYAIAHSKSMSVHQLEMMKRAGCWFIEMGIESGNDDILKRIHKSATKKEIAIAASNARAAGLRTKGNFIFGFPWDTTATLEESIQFALDIDIDFFQQSYLTVWPGCALFSEVGARPTGSHRPETATSAWGTLAHQRITYVPPGLSHDLLVKLSRSAFRRFYLRPKIVLRILPIMLSWRGFRLGIVSFIVFLRTIMRKDPMQRRSDNALAT
jgi:radical SAM superfamily enzyme YgiQ (UPF0313 family)